MARGSGHWALGKRRDMAIGNRPWAVGKRQYYRQKAIGRGMRQEAIHEHPCMFGRRTWVLNSCVRPHTHILLTSLEVLASFYRSF